MDTIVRRVPDSPNHWMLSVPMMLVSDPRLDADAVQIYMLLAGSGRAPLTPDYFSDRVARAVLDLENAGWLIVVREASQRVLVLLNTRNTTPTDAIRQAYPEGTPEAMHQGTLQAIGSPGDRPGESPEADSVLPSRGAVA